MQFLHKFKHVNLDCMSNTVSLCSNCHNKIHYGINPENVLLKLYCKRKESLNAAGMNITFEELLEFYK